MGFGKRFLRAAKGVATAGLSETKVGKQIGKTALSAGRTAYAATGGGGPLTGFAGLFLQPEQMGIKSKQNQGLFTRVQQGGRIATAIGGAALGGAGLAGAGPLGGMLGGTGTSLGGMFGGGGGFGSMLGKGALATLQGGLFGGGGFGGGAGAGGGGGRGPLSPYARELMGKQEGIIGREAEMAGASPEAEQFYRHQATQALRAGQAERGIFESGVSSAQEAELSPQIEEQIRRARLGELAGISGQYGELAGLAAGAGPEQGSPWAGMAGQFAGNIGYNLLSKYFGGK